MSYLFMIFLFLIGILVYCIFYSNVEYFEDIDTSMIKPQDKPTNSFEAYVDNTITYGDIKGNEKDNIHNYSASDYTHTYNIVKEENSTPSNDFQTGGVDNSSREQGNITIPTIDDIRKKRDELVEKEDPLIFHEPDEVETKENQLKKILPEPKENELETISMNVSSLLSQNNELPYNINFDNPGFYMSENNALAIFSKLQQ